MSANIHEINLLIHDHKVDDDTILHGDGDAEIFSHFSLKFVQPQRGVPRVFGQDVKRLGITIK